MAMKLIKKTPDYKIYVRGDDRYAVQDANGKPVNGEEKVRILLAEELLRWLFPIPSQSQPQMLRKVSPRQVRTPPTWKQKSRRKSQPKRKQSRSPRQTLCQRLSLRRQLKMRPPKVRKRKRQSRPCPWSKNPKSRLVPAFLWCGPHLYSRRKTSVLVGFISP